MDVTRRRAVLDRVAGVALAVVVLVAGLLREADRWWGGVAGAPASTPYLLDLPPWLLVTAHVAGALLLLGRRRHPYPVGLLLAALSVLTPVLAATLVPYAVARHGSSPWVSAGVNVVVVAGLLTGADLWHLVGGTRYDLGDPYTPAIIAAALTGFGLYFRARAGLVAALVARAENAERERGLREEQARTTERLRLATELHDAVSRSATVLVLQAGAHAVGSPHPAVREVAEQLRVSGSVVLDDLQGLIRVLTDDEPVRPAPRSISELVGSLRLPLAVTVEEAGDPSAAPAATVLAAHHVVREGLVNAGKHAAGASVTVRADYAGAEVRLRVSDSGPRHPVASVARPSGAGLGLASLHRRCEAVGGRLTAGPSAGGGFELRAVLPGTPPGAR